MSYKIFRLILALTLLLGGLIWVKHRYFEPDFSIKIHFKDSSIQAPYQFIADTSLYPFSSYEGKMAASSNFFSEKFISYFPSVLGDWVGKDIERPPKPLASQEQLEEYFDFKQEFYWSDKSIKIGNKELV